MHIATGGAAGDLFPLPDPITASHNVVDPADANARITIQASGDIARIQGAGSTDIGDWISPKANMAQYEAQLVPTSGTLSVGVVNTWQQLNLDRQYGVQQAVVGSKDFDGTLEIRRVGGSVVLASVAVSLHAQVTV